MRRLSCSSFIKIFRKFLIDESSHTLVYDFERANVTVGNKRKVSGKGCDYVVVSRNDSNCYMVLIECKGGQLSISDFEDAKKQLKESIDFVKNAFDDEPDLAVICYERCSAHVRRYLLNDIYKPLQHNVRLILKKADDAKCRFCR